MTTSSDFCLGEKAVVNGIALAATLKGFECHWALKACGTS